MKRSSLAVVALGILAFVPGCTIAEGQASSRAPEVTIRAIQAQEAGAVGRVAGMEGDYVVRGGSLRVLVGGLSRPPNDRGRVLAVQSPGSGASDDLEFIAPVILRGDRAYPVRARSLTVTNIAGRNALAIEGTVRHGGREIVVERIVTMADTPSTLAIYTRVERADGLSIAERVGWAGQPPFVPWLGTPEDEDWRDADWIGTEGARRSIVLGFRSGAARARARLHRERDQAVLDATELAVRLPSDGSQVRTLLAFSRGELAMAVRRLGWARGRPFPEASVGLSHMPSEAAVIVADRRSRPWIRTRIGARLQVPLPHEEIALVARATAYGHTASEDHAIEANSVLRLRLPQAGQLRASALDQDGEPLAFRVRVARIGRSTPHPDLGPIWAAAGARDVAVSEGAALDLSLPIGVYEVSVMHGPEWSMEQQRVVVTGVGTSEVTARLRREVDAGAWVACDFHLHSEPSPDSHVTLADRVRALLAEGVRFAVATDHNHVTDFAPSVRELGSELGSVTGVEVTTDAPAFGHFNAFPYPLDPALPGNGAPGFSGLTPAQLFADLRAGSPGVIVQVNHPRFEGGIGYFDVTGFDPATGQGDATYSDDYDALEVWNGYDQRRPDRVERNIAEWISMLARGRRVIATGNSDSHNVRNELAGYPRTYVYAERFDPLSEIGVEPQIAPPVDGGPGFDAGVAAAPIEAPMVEVSPDAGRLLDALRAGRAFVTNGPMLDVRIDGHGPGERVQASGSVEVEIRVLAPSWMAVDAIDIYAGDRIVETLPIEPRRARRSDPRGLRFSHRARVTVEASTFLIAVVRGEQPMDAFFTRPGIRPLAFTNPIWVDAPP